MPRRKARSRSPRKQKRAPSPYAIGAAAAAGGALLAAGLQKFLGAKPASAKPAALVLPAAAAPARAAAASSEGWRDKLEKLAERKGAEIEELKARLVAAADAKQAEIADLKAQLQAKMDIEKKDIGEVEAELRKVRQEALQQGNILRQGIEEYKKVVEQKNQAAAQIEEYKKFIGNAAAKVKQALGEEEAKRVNLQATGEGVIKALQGHLRQREEQAAQFQQQAQKAIQEAKEAKAQVETYQSFVREEAQKVRAVVEQLNREKGIAIAQAQGWENNAKGVIAQYQKVMEEQARALNDEVKRHEEERGRIIQAVQQLQAQHEAKQREMKQFESQAREVIQRQTERKQQLETELKNLQEQATAAIAQKELEKQALGQRASAAVQVLQTEGYKMELQRNEARQKYMQLLAAAHAEVKRTHEQFQLMNRSWEQKANEQIAIIQGKAQLALDEAYKIGKQEGMEQQEVKNQKRARAEKAAELRRIHEDYQQKGKAMANAFLNQAIIPLQQDRDRALQDIAILQRQNDELFALFEKGGQEQFGPEMGPARPPPAFFGSGEQKLQLPGQQLALMGPAMMEGIEEQENVPENIMMPLPPAALALMGPPAAAAPPALTHLNLNRPRPSRSGRSPIETRSKAHTTRRGTRFK